MTSGDGRDNGDREASDCLIMASGQFDAIFQIVKEAPNLSAQLLGRVELSAGDVASAVSAARQVDREIGGSELVRFRLAGPAPADGVGESKPLSFLMASAGEVEAVISRSLLRTWWVLAESVLASLGARELFLRTGYDVDALALACRSLLD